MARVERGANLQARRGGPSFGGSVFSSSSRRGLSSGRRELSSSRRGLSSSRRGLSSGRRGLSSRRRELSSGRRGLLSRRRGLSSRRRGLLSSLTLFRDRRHRMRRRGPIRNAQSPGRPEYPARLVQLLARQGRSREADGASRPLTRQELDKNSKVQGGRSRTSAT